MLHVGPLCANERCVSLASRAGGHPTFLARRQSGSTAERPFRIIVTVCASPSCTGSQHTWEGGEGRGGKGEEDVRCCNGVRRGVAMRHRALHADAPGIRQETALSSSSASASSAGSFAFVVFRGTIAFVAFAPLSPTASSSPLGTASPSRSSSSPSALASSSAT